MPEGTKSAEMILQILPVSKEEKAMTKEVNWFKILGLKVILLTQWSQVWILLTSCYIHECKNHFSIPLHTLNALHVIFKYYT